MFQNFLTHININVKFNVIVIKYANDTYIIIFQYEMELGTLRQKLRLSQCKVQQTRAQLELQKLRTKQLVSETIY